jgi:hypothetical protein
MQLPLLRTYELDYYDYVRLFLKEDSKIFKYLGNLDTSHNISGRVFIKGKFVKIQLQSNISQTDLPASEKYYFVESSDVKRLKDPYLLVVPSYSEIPKYVLEIDQADIVSIELLLDYTVR